MCMMHAWKINVWSIIMITLMETCKGPVGGAIFVASYLLLIFRVEQLVTSTI